jgi:signal transduction histidine kinase
MRTQLLPRCRGLLLAVGVALPLAGTPAQTASPRPALTNVAQLRALSAAEAAERLPVRLRGVVTALNPGASVFIQDETGGTFITRTAEKITRTLKPEDEVLVEGVSYEGLFLPGVASATVKRVGRAELPHPMSVTYDDLLSGRFHYERVEVSGIVRSVEWFSHRRCFVLKVAVGTRKLDVELVDSSVTNLPPLVNARVRATGLAAGYINPRRQLRSPALLVSRREDLRVEVPPPADIFQEPQVATTELLKFTPDGLSSHRVRVRGVVTHQQPGETVFLRDATDGLLVRTAQTNHVQAGDVIEVAGFPAMGRFGAFLEDAEFRVVGREFTPEPVPSSVRRILRGSNDANLVTLEARLLDLMEGDAESVLVLGQDDTVFRARLSHLPPALRHGSVLQLTGVCRVSDSDLAGPRFRANPLEMELLLRSPADILVLSQPSGWTSQRFGVVVGGLLALALAACGWVVLLRRRVARQRAVILEKVQREAVLEERHRMAREMHDTLAQSFSGLGFQLDALNTRLPPEQSDAHAQLEVAREMVRHGREGLRRSLMNLRAQELERGDLAEVLPELARQITVGTGIELRCAVERPPHTLPENVEANLLRIGQECLVNAVRHAHPKSIQLALHHEPGQVRLRITDDGAGFDPAQLNGNGNGHFGWRGIHERAAQIGAVVELESRPGRGTTITVTALLQS